MEVILSENFPSLGYVGECVSVKRGYARNYLIPRGIAVEASSRNARMLAHQKAVIESKKKKLQGEAEALGNRLKALNLEFTLKAGAHGKSFGSITTRDIERGLKEKEFDIQKKQIRLAEPIKSGGEFHVPIKLHTDVEVEVKVTVTTAQAQEKKEAEKKEEAPKAEEQILEEEIEAAEQE